MSPAGLVDDLALAGEDRMGAGPTGPCGAHLSEFPVTDDKTYAPDIGTRFRRRA